MVKHTFEHGQVPVICDLEKAKQIKTEIDAKIEEDIQLLRKKYIKGNKIKIVSFILTVLFFVLFLLSARAENTWLFVVFAVLGIISGYVTLKTPYYTKYFEKSRDYKFDVQTIKNKHLYPMSVQFFMLQKEIKVVKAKLIYSKSNEYATLSLYWIDENDIVQKTDIDDLKVNYKKGVVDTSVDLDNECVVRPFVDSTEF